MINELIVGKITLESIKYLLERVAKEERNTFRILSSLSDITTIGMTLWLLSDFTGEVLNVLSNIANKEEYEEEEEEVVKSEAVLLKKGTYNFST
jgi:hypothetical protein